MKPEIATILDVLKNSRQVLISSHIQPDGDAVGSMAGLAHIAVSFGAKVVHYNVSAQPDDFLSLEMNGPWVRSLAELGDFVPDLIAAVDCGDAHRLGPELAAVIGERRSINIDHHLGNPAYATVANWVEPSMIATAQMIGELAQAAGLELSGTLGEAVYLGLSTDSGSFSYGSTTPESMEMGAEILRHGYNLSDFFNKFMRTWSIDRLHLWGWLMQHIELHADGRIAISVITGDVLRRFNAGRNDLEGFASFLRCLEGVDLTLLVRENGIGHAKASFRSTGAINVRDMAAEFGGGGHKNAAGAELPEEPESAAVRFLEAAQRHLALQLKKV